MSVGADNTGSRSSMIPPELPGVYIMKSKSGKVLYVGKAKNLRQRLRYYRQEELDPRHARLVRETEDISFIVTQNELEALVLEANLIKQYRPKYNVILRDDKNYPYIKIVLNERYPHLEVARRIKDDGSLYFGPYVPAGVMWEALSFIRRNFNIRPCRYKLDRPIKPCIQYQMGRCPGPCAELISEEDYKKALSEVILFLKGQRRDLLEGLELRMQRYAEEMRFEEAAKLRDRIRALKRLWDNQRVQSTIMDDTDIIGYDLGGGPYNSGRASVFVLLFLRHGLITGKKEFLIRGALQDRPAELLEEFIEVFYSKEIIPPKIILVAEEPAHKEMLESWLSRRRREPVVIRKPMNKEEEELLRMAQDNARVYFDQKTLKLQRIRDTLKELLGLSRPPQSIGAFDISTTFGRESTGGFVWWQDDEFLKERYRHVRVQYQDGMNDYAMLEEVIKRVIDNLTGAEPGGDVTVEGGLPDLLIVDGGMGHLEVLRRVIEEYRRKGIFEREPDLVAIAKSPDRAFLPDGREVMLMGLGVEHEEAALLLRKIRDEVHRFAIMYHRKIRDKRLIKSSLEEIPGIGPKRRLELLRAFGSLDAIRKATPEEIVEKVPGIGLKRAQLILETLLKSESESL